MPDVLSIPEIGQNATLFVDPLNGDDDTGERGYRTLPFETPQAAIDAADPFDLILMAPGTYDQGGVRITHPVPDLVLSGLGKEVSILQFDGSITSGGTCVEMYQGSGKTTVRNLRINNPFLASASPTIGCNPSSSPGTSPEMVVEDCHIVGASDGLYLGTITGARMTARRCIIEGNWDLMFTGSTAMRMDCYECEFNWSFGNGQTQTRAGILLGLHTFLNSRFRFSGNNTTGTKGQGLAVSGQQVAFGNCLFENTVTGSFLCEMTIGGASPYVRVFGGCRCNWGNCRHPSTGRPISVVFESGPCWVPIVITDTDLTAASTVQDFSLFDLPGRTSVLGCYATRTIGSGFTGTGISAVTLEVGISGSTAKYLPQSSVFAGSNALIQPSMLPAVELATGNVNKTRVNARITATGGNVSALSGSGTTYTVYLLVSGYWVGSSG